jgi:pimeloyl-ACP methyl ester carboxylesterase
LPASVLIYDDLREVILAGSSSSGAVISGVADRVPERISQLVYVDAFVPDDGQAVFDLISPQRRPAMEALVESEGFGWLLPRWNAGTPTGVFSSWKAATCLT